MDIFEEEILVFFRLLNKYKVRFLLVGGLAVNYHGHSRTTGDVDLWIDESGENRKKLVAALQEREIDGCEAFLTYPLVAGFAEILLDNGIYIDLMGSLQFFTYDKFEECYTISEKFLIEKDLEIKVLHINKLIEEKEKSNRLKDKEDAIQLRKINKLNG
jgi:hypothetical protein